MISRLSSMSVARIHLAPFLGYGDEYTLPIPPTVPPRSSPTSSYMASGLVCILMWLSYASLLHWDPCRRDATHFDTLDSTNPSHVMPCAPPSCDIGCSLTSSRRRGGSFLQRSRCFTCPTETARHDPARRRATTAGRESHERGGTPA
jgi:hypothetical protein